jgi:glyoxylase-like metal-dependent hydrolase (beta-lactamase superfamily II)
MIYHLNCGTLRPYLPKIQSLVYCLLVETNRGMVLVDTGFGTRDYSHPSLMMNVFLRLLGVPRDTEETAVKQIEALGYQPEDIKHILLTHLHLDHAGGLPDFPQAQVHVYRGEYDAMVHRRGLLSWGYDRHHFQHQPNWVFHDGIRVDWYGFQSLPVFDDCQPELRFILLPGHTVGHCGVAIQTPKGWLLHSGDAASPFNRHTDVYERPADRHLLQYLPKWFAQWFMGSQIDALRQLRVHLGDQIDIISGHDIVSFNQFTSQNTSQTHVP